ncbi:helix-turn-helix transcriptional regulator [Haladaptatus pallidirubidus]|uniref:DUF7343 domain-containing protein n=1 Tax=Haladaptatus pallidirubidus TaxID=1008152 RepID=A0AAV3UIN1_9EURY
MRVLAFLLLWVGRGVLVWGLCLIGSLFLIVWWLQVDSRVLRKKANKQLRTAYQDTEFTKSEFIQITDREYIRRLLRSHDGEMYQTEIVESTNWSKTKVSVKLSEMQSDGEITKIRLGRENLVVLPGSEPEIISEQNSRTGQNH